MAITHHRLAGGECADEAERSMQDELTTRVHAANLMSW
jgi:hypothetical protein